MSDKATHLYLGLGRFAIIDESNYEYLKVYAWQCERKKRSWYAYTVISGTKRVFKLYMHRLIASTPANMVTHHVNRNSLDNRRANLQNMLRSDHKLEHINNPVKVVSTQSTSGAV